MEKCLGTFPLAVLDKAPDFKKYFHSSNNKVKVEDGKLDDESLHHVESMKTLSKIVREEHHDDFLVLLEGLLRMDPSERMTANEALKMYGKFDPSSQ
jgi:hypothetical protein